MDLSQAGLRHGHGQSIGNMLLESSNRPMGLGLAYVVGMGPCMYNYGGIRLKIQRECIYIYIY